MPRQFLANDYANKRYGQTPAATGNYFTQEIIRVLADNDRSLMGDGFSH